VKGVKTSGSAWNPGFGHPSAFLGLNEPVDEVGNRVGCAVRRAVVAALRERAYEPYEDDNGVIRLRNCPFHQLAQQNRGVVCTMNLSLLEGLLAGLDTNDFSPLTRDRAGPLLRRAAAPCAAQTELGPASAFNPQRQLRNVVAPRR
jgi:hypothetical protein